MADFSISNSKTKAHEGGYANDHHDRGGETYRGIARNFHKDWAGWSIIDNYKSFNDFPKNLESLQQLQRLIDSFYKKEFWDKMRLDELGYQSVADELYDNAVNAGIKNSVLFLQKALNLLNNSESFYKNIKEDGELGLITMKTLNDCLRIRSITLLLNLVNYHQMEHYVNLMKKKEVHEKYIGWFNRVEITKG